MAVDARLEHVVEELASRAARGQLVLLVGAGVSRWAGLPTWREAIGQLARDLPAALRRAVPAAAIRFEPPGPAERLNVQDFLRIGDAYRQVCGEEQLVSRLRQLFDGSRVDPSTLPLHRLLVELAELVPAIYTTNFDDLVERAFAAAGRSVQVVSTAADLQDWKYDRVDGVDAARYPIYKLHGTLERPETLVLGEADYHRRSALAANPIDLRFSSDVVGRAVLLVGYSFSDPNLRWLWTKLRELEVVPVSYLVELGESSDLDVVTFRRDRVTPIDLQVSDPRNPVELHDLLRAVLERSRGRPSRGRADRPAGASLPREPRA